MRRAFGWASVVVFFLVLASAWYLWPSSSPQSPHQGSATISQGDRPALSSEEPKQPPKPEDGKPTASEPFVDSNKKQGKAAAVPPSPPHPLLGNAQAVVLGEKEEATQSTIEADMVEAVRAAIASGHENTSLAQLTIDYPQNETVFPPEFVPPTFLWHEPTAEADTWAIDVAWSGQEERLCILSAGSPPPPGTIDPDCIAKNNEIYQPTPYQASARSWTPGDRIWATIRQTSVTTPARVSIFGLRSDAPEQVVSRGEISITTAEDPVGAPIFYRDVPLAPAVTRRGVIAPLGENAVRLIGWRLREVSRPESRLLLSNIPTCTNCHSFSRDGNTLGMDLDGPNGDKGSYAFAPMTREMVIDEQHVINWNSFPDKPPKQKTIGFLSRVSPDGQYVATTLNEEVFVTNFLDYKFLQVFYPTRGILGYYDRSSEEIRTLPGADDPNFVHCDPVWTPDGKHLVFARAKAKNAYSADTPLPEHANDPGETPIQYDLVRIAFGGGQGGQPEPIAGASANGMSNTFPKVSPDGKWIVFVKCRNGQLMRPDSTLWIVPIEGGTARKMRCNTRLMNSWHSFSPNGSWMVFSSKANTPYTQMFLTHIDDEGNDSPPVLIPNSTAANRAVNLPEFVNRPYDELVSIQVKALEYLQHGLRGIQLARQGNFDQALAELETAIDLQPDYWLGHANAAVVLIDQGKVDEGMARLKQVIEANPDRAQAYDSVGRVLAKRGMFDDAMNHFRKALELDPGYAEAHTNLATLFRQQGRLEEATRHFSQAVDLQQNNPVTHVKLAGVLIERNMIGPAVEHLQEALQLDPQLLDAHLALANVRVGQNNYAAAVAQLEEAMAALPNNLRPANDLAWLLAVCPQGSVRDGARAVQLAERACRMTRQSNPVLLGTLAAAYAEAGRFTDAIDTVTRAMRLVAPQDKLLAEQLRRQLLSYRSGKLWIPSE